MRDIMPYIVMFANCCVGPVLILLVGIFIGKNGLPRLMWQKRARQSKFAADE